MSRSSDLTRQAIGAEVAKALVEARSSRGFSMNRLAEAAGLSLTMISYVERGIRNPTLDTLLRVSEALELDLAAVIAKAIQTVQRRQAKRGKSGAVQK